MRNSAFPLIVLAIIVVIIALSLGATAFLPSTTTTFVSNANGSLVTSTIIDPLFLGHDYHSFLTLEMAFAVIPLVLIVKRLANDKTTETKSNGVFNQLWSFLGGKNGSITKGILNLGFIAAAFISLWGLVRTAAVATVQLLASEWQVGSSVSQIIYMLEFALFIYLMFSFHGLLKEDEPKAENAIQIAIIAFVIALLQIIANFTDSTLYNIWYHIFPWALPSTLIGFVGAIVVLSILLSKLRKSS